VGPCNLRNNTFKWITSAFIVLSHSLFTDTSPFTIYNIYIWTTFVKKSFRNETEYSRVHFDIVSRCDILVCFPGTYCANNERGNTYVRYQLWQLKKPIRLNINSRPNSGNTARNVYCPLTMKILWIDLLKPYTSDDEVCGSHSGECQNNCLLECDAAQLVYREQRLRGARSFHLLSWRWRLQVPPNCWCQSTELHVTTR
jgi:hypothetical protein